MSGPEVTRAEKKLRKLFKDIFFRTALQRPYLNIYIFRKVQSITVKTYWVEKPFALYIALLVLYVRTMHPWEDGLAGYATWREEVQSKN